MQILFKSIGLIVLLFPKLMFSAQDGSLGTSSTGNVNVSITVPALVQISGLSDIGLGSTSTFPASGNTTACVYSNVVSPSGSYFVTGTSANTSGTDFRVSNGSDDFITYTATWTGSGSPVTLVSGTKTVQQTGGSSTSVTCGGTPNATFSISFTSVQGAPPGDYDDVVTLLITSA